MGKQKERFIKRSASHYKIIAKEDDVSNDDTVYFGSDPKGEHRSDMKSLFEIPNEVEYKPPPAGCELGNLKGIKNMMQRDAHCPDFCTLLQHDEVVDTSEERINLNENPNPTITIVESYEPSSLAGGKVERKIHKEKCKSLQDNWREDEGGVLPTHL